MSTSTPGYWTNSIGSMASFDLQGRSSSCEFGQEQAGDPGGQHGRPEARTAPVRQDDRPLEFERLGWTAYSLGFGEGR